MVPAHLIAPLVVPALLATLGVVAPDTSASADATVTLRVGPVGFAVPNHGLADNPSAWIVDTCVASPLNALDGVACCSVDAPDADANGRVQGGEVLDAATAAGCISGWAATDFPCCGQFVTMVDGREELGWPVTWWYVQRNGESSPVGIDDMDLVDGDSLEFIYYAGPV